MLQLLGEDQVPGYRLARTFRHQPWGYIFFMAIMIVSGIGLGMVAWRHTQGWAWLLVAPFALFVAMIYLLVVHACWGGVVACAQPTNWLMKVADDGLYLHLRSYLNHHMKPLGPVVAFLPWSDIASVGRTTYVHRSKRNRRNTMKWEHYLDIQTRGLDAAVLDQVIAAERARSAEGGRFVKTKAGHVPVQVPRPDWIRVEWRPGMLEAMPAAVEVRAPLRLEFDLASATPEQIDEEVLRLIETQDVLAAIALLGVARGMSTGEAQRLVNELTQTLARPPAA